MAGERKYTRIPPESTGDRVLLLHTQEVAFDQLQNSHIWQRDAQYTITGGASPITITLHRAITDTATTGYIVYEIDTDQNYLTAPDPQVGNAIRLGDAGGTIVAYISGSPYCVYINGQSIVGKDNSTYAANVDRFGALYTRFSEGPPELTPFGELRSSQKSLLGQYMFTKGRLSSEFSNTLKNNGRVIYKADDASVELVVPDTGVIDLPTLNIPMSTHTSNVYHPCIPGSGVLVLMATRCGDDGTSSAGVIRRWGAFDADNGFFFQLNGSVLSVVHRRTFGSKTEGTTVQSDWNKDTLDGSGGTSNPSGVNLNITRNNLYWIDYQNLGGGTIRWGVFNNGVRIVCHEMDMGNGGVMGNWNHNALPNPNLPICWSIVRTANDVSTGDRYLRAYGASVWSEGKGISDIMAEADVRAYDDNYTITEDSPYTQGAYYLFSIRPFANIPNDAGTSTANHSLYKPERLTIDVYDQDGNDVRGELRLFSQCVLKGENFQPISFTTVEEDEDGFHIGHGPEIYRTPVKGPTEIKLGEIFKTIQNGTLKNNSEAATARRRQNIVKVSGNTDPYGIGTTNYPVSCVTVTVGANPIYGASNVHFFTDRSAVIIEGLSDLTGPITLNDNTYYLSLRNSSTAQLYSTINDLEDDRATRILTIENTGEHHGHEGDSIWIESGLANPIEVEILAISNSGSDTKFYVGRRAADIDSITASNTFSIDRDRDLDSISGDGATVTVISYEHHLEDSDYIRIAGTEKTIGAIPTFTITNSAWSSGTPNIVTHDTEQDHGLAVGDYVTITGSNISEYNYTGIVSSVSDANTFILTTTQVSDPGTGTQGTVTGTRDQRYNFFSVAGVTATNGSDTLTRAAGGFSQFAPNDFIEINRRYYKVDAVTNDTSLTIKATDDSATTFSGVTGSYTLYEVRPITIVDEDADEFTYAGTETSSPATLTNTGSLDSYHHHTLKSNVTVNSVNTYPLDYETTLNAVNSSLWGNPNAEEEPSIEVTPGDNFGLSNATLDGTPVSQPAWTFMWRPVNRPDTPYKSQSVRFNMQWKERIQ